MPNLDGISIEDLPDFSGDDAAAVGDASIILEAVEAGVKLNEDILPTIEQPETKVALETTFKPPEPTG